MKNKIAVRKIRFFILLMVAFLTVGMIAFPAAARDYSRRSDLKLEVELGKTVFKFGEPVYGYLKVMNYFPTSQTMTFEIRIFQNGSLVDTLETQFDAVFPGWTKYSFQDLGIYQVISPGVWWVWINQKDVDPAYATLAEFEILPPGEEGEGM